MTEINDKQDEDVTSYCFYRITQSCKHINTYEGKSTQLKKK